MVLTPEGQYICRVTHPPTTSSSLEAQSTLEFYLAEAQRLAHTGSWAFTAAGFTHWSPELFAIHGLAPGGKAPSIAEYLARVHPDDREHVAQVIQKMLADAKEEKHGNR